MSYLERRLVTSNDVQATTVQIKVPVPIPDSQQSGLAADSAGVKWTSSFRIPLKVTTQGTNAIPVGVGIQASWTATATDSVLKVAVIQDAGGTTTEVVSVSGNTGTDSYAESTTIDTSQDSELYVQAEITTASGTGGATTDLQYATVVIIYQLSVV